MRNGNVKLIAAFVVVGGGELICHKLIFMIFSLIFRVWWAPMRYDL